MENLIAIIKEGKVDNVIVASDEFAATLQEETVNVTGERTVWLRRRFIPLSDIDESELVKERESDLVLTTPQS